MNRSSKDATLFISAVLVQRQPRWMWRCSSAVRSKYSFQTSILGLVNRNNRAKRARGAAAKYDARFFVVSDLHLPSINANKASGSETSVSPSKNLPSIV